MAGPRQDEPADEVGVVERDLLGDAAAEREAEQVDPLVAERADEGGGVGGDRDERVRDLAAGRADPAVVEGMTWRWAARPSMTAGPSRPAPR